ncbi:AEC family transporter [Pisciglobus halotolerans]|uniref:Permease n=1 Tax=Pisciglobus halotolerans TaxID=745365 RepID=A0A1I3BRR8_9LACT|nr:AEC family transporter [Pisciglobus halotolerans]SFH64987.1 hypothetical protein SAMN04489868_1092 [Pisciglobus halotolerans]
MLAILIQAIRFIAVILAAYFFKRTGFLKQADGDTVSRIIVYFTLPATIIIGMSGTELNRTVLLFMTIGLLANLMLSLVGGFLWHKKGAIDQSMMVFTISGYNIGNFALPFIQGFFPAAIPLLGSFDIGNALMLSGGTSLMVDQMDKEQQEKIVFTDMLRRLFASPPFTTYILMFGLALFHYTLPSPVMSVVEIFASGNAFLSMFMIGLYLELNVNRFQLKKAFRLLGIRYGSAAILSVLLYLVLPLSPIEKGVLVLVLFSPFASLHAINAILYKNEPSFVGFISSLSIICSLILMTGIFALLF